MARTQSRYYPNDALFRAKIEMVNRESNEIHSTTHYGPYASAATAKGVASGKLRWANLHSFDYVVTIQKANTVWEDVE